MRITPHGPKMPGWMIERTAKVRLEDEAGETPESSFRLTVSIQALSQNSSFVSALAAQEKRSVLISLDTRHLFHG